MQELYRQAFLRRFRRIFIVTVFNCYEKFVMKTFVDFTFAHPMRYMWMLRLVLSLKHEYVIKKRMW